MKKKSSNSLWVQRKACLKAAKKCVYCLLYIYLHEWRKTISRKGLNLGRFYLKKTYPQVHSKFILISCLQFNEIKNIWSAHFTLPVPLHNLTDTYRFVLHTPTPLPAFWILPPPTPSPHPSPLTRTHWSTHIYTNLPGGTEKVCSYLLIISPQPV